jgi:hypothetical protein
MIQFFTPPLCIAERGQGVSSWIMQGEEAINYIKKAESYDPAFQIIIQNLIPFIPAYQVM